MLTSRLNTEEDEIFFEGQGIEQSHLNQTQQVEKKDFLEYINQYSERNTKKYEQQKKNYRQMIKDSTVMPPQAPIVQPIEQRLTEPLVPEEPKQMKEPDPSVINPVASPPNGEEFEDSTIFYQSENGVGPTFNTHPFAQ